MKKFVIIIVLLLLIAQSISGQYSLMTKGELNPFDSAVAIRLDTYRLESQKMKLADEMIGNLSLQVRELEMSNLSLNKQLFYTNNLLEVKNEMISSKQNTIDELLVKINYKPKETWWDKNYKTVIFIGGVSVGVGSMVLLMNLVK